MHGVSETEWVTRFLPVRAAKVDVQDDKRLVGYAIVFNALSQDLGGWFEEIAPSAVDRTLKSGTNVDALLDHRQDTMNILGSTDSGLLKLAKDRSGLKADVTPPDTSNARDVLIQVRAGLVRGMSFRFRIWDPAGDGNGRVWREDEDGRIIRTVTDMEFSEVSFVVNPAYLQTSVSVRTAEIDKLTLEEFRSSKAWKPSLKLRERMAKAGMR